MINIDGTEYKKIRVSKDAIGFSVGSTYIIDGVDWFVDTFYIDSDNTHVFLLTLGRG